MMGRLYSWILVILGAVVGARAATEGALVELNQRAFFYGREYFVLRSGRAQMVVQADRADLGPAFTFLLFDAEDARQSASKRAAFNFTPTRGVADSGLVVELGGFPFTALGHRTQTRWVWTNGVPAVEAVWWAGGVRVSERLTALTEGGLFERSITLAGANLVDAEPVTLRLALPGGASAPPAQTAAPTGATPPASRSPSPNAARLAWLPLGELPSATLTDPPGLAIGPLLVPPGGRLEARALLVVQIPAGDAATFQSRVGALALTDAADEWDRTRTRWAVASSLRTRDQTVRALFDKARFGLPGMIALDGTMDAGLFEYGAQWVRDTANTALGALHAGLFEEARQALGRILSRMITPAGATMIAGGFDAPDREQFDQMGELLEALKAYRDWTGDTSLIRAYAPTLLALIERPLQPRFRDATGMVHDRREFWERELDDGYELAYQTYVVLGLRDAIALAPLLGAADRVDQWRAEADLIQHAMLAHPSRALVAHGRLIKRRYLNGVVADEFGPAKGYAPDTPLSTETRHRLLPDASEALPIALGVVAPHSTLAHRTLDALEELWNTRWADGGYDRYATSAQPDQPGPWPFATCFILRAQHDAGLFDRSRRSLEWLNSVQGGRAGAWFEEIPSIRSLNNSSGIVCWTSGEVALFIVRHYLGVRFEGDTPVIRPALYPGSPPVEADLRFRRGRLRLRIEGAGRVRSALVNGVRLRPDPDGALRLPPDFALGTVVVRSAR